MSTRREELILRLLTQYYLNVADQAEFGSNTIVLAELARVVTKSLETNDFFPPTAKPWEQGEPCYEGAFLEKQGDHRFRVHHQRSYADNPGVCAERTSRDYDDFDSALRAFLHAEWRGAFDGERLTVKVPHT